MIKHYKKVIEYEIEIDESVLTKLIDNAMQKFQEDDVVDTETIFEEIFFNSNEKIEILIDGNPWSITEVELYYSEEIYDVVYDIIDDYVTEYLKKEE